MRLVTAGCDSGRAVRLTNTPRRSGCGPRNVSLEAHAQSRGMSSAYQQSRSELFVCAVQSSSRCQGAPLKAASDSWLTDGAITPFKSASRNLSGRNNFARQAPSGSWNQCLIESTILLICSHSQILEWKACLEILSGPRSRHFWNVPNNLSPAWPVFSSIPCPLSIQGEPGMN